MSRALCVLIVLFMHTALSLSQHRHALYAGEEQRAVKTLSAEETQALLRGEGMGLAKAAELNHYPGPRHVLDLGTPLQLSETQRAATQAVYDRMYQEAVRLGALIVEREQDLDRLFATGMVTTEPLRHLTLDIAQLRGNLRLVHLQAHVKMKGVLSAEQITHYDALRGYAAEAASPPHTGHQHHHH